MTSTTAAEIYAIMFAAKQLLQLMRFLKELQIPFNTPQLWNDNKSAIHVVQTGKSSTALDEVEDLEPDADNHFDIQEVNCQVQYLLQLFKEGKISLDYIRTSENVADIFTKPLAAPAFVKCRSFLLEEA